MVGTRLLVVFALLQITCFPFHEVSAETCHASGFIHGKGQHCYKEKGLGSCCVAGKRYPQFRCSPPVSAKTSAILTLNRFDNGEDGQGNGMTSCDMLFHTDKQLVVVLPSGWLRLDGTNRCNKKIRISANGRSVLAKVVDECDSVNGCDAEHAFEPPCRNNVLNASPAVWKALRLNETIGELKVKWSDV
ncbi:hypothetical protein U9M48_009590 [Paspalum notatum var. saurae]|uniref:Uncharacterized protein n=1 Tax=Paspalum notatum var. saurae TaxID=547442 RepID=A0AAQ3SRG9_PASNO